MRLAASLALDRQALNEAETPGLSRPVGSIVPRDFEFALPVEAHPHDPARARKLLAEAGYPNGFDGGELTPFLQRVVYEQLTQAAIYHLGFPIGVGPRVEDIMVTAIPGFYMSPYEDLRLRRP